MFLSKWREFPSAPCLAGKETWWQLASRFCWNRARSWQASELVSSLVRLRTNQHRGTCVWAVITSHALPCPCICWHAWDPERALHWCEKVTATFASYLRRLLDCSLCGGGLSGSKTADLQPDITNWNLDLNIGWCGWGSSHLLSAVPTYCKGLQLLDSQAVQFTITILLLSLCWQAQGQSPQLDHFQPDREPYDTKSESLPAATIERIPPKHPTMNQLNLLHDLQVLLLLLLLSSSSSSSPSPPPSSASSSSASSQSVQWLDYGLDHPVFES